MPAYLHANIEVTDAAIYDEYRAQVGATVTAHGGRFVVRGGAMQVLEGPSPNPRQIILEFPSMAALLGWYHSPEYAPLIALRQRGARGTLVAIEGA